MKLKAIIFTALMAVSATTHAAPFDTVTLSFKAKRYAQTHNLQNKNIWRCIDQHAKEHNVSQGMRKIAVNNTRYIINQPESYSNPVLTTYNCKHGNDHPAWGFPQGTMVFHIYEWVDSPEYRVENRIHLYNRGTDRMHIVYNRVPNGIHIRCLGTFEDLKLYCPPWGRKATVKQRETAQFPERDKNHNRRSIVKRYPKPDPRLNLHRKLNPPKRKRQCKPVSPWNPHIVKCK